MAREKEKQRTKLKTREILGERRRRQPRDKSIDERKIKKEKARK